MPQLFVPPKVARELVEEQRVKQRARLLQMFDFDDPVCREWAEELRKLDPLVRLARAQPMAYEPGFNVLPNFYHFLRDNPGAPMTVSAITGPDGEWVEPDSALLERLRQNDLQNPAVYRALLAKQFEEEREVERAKAEQLERANEEVIERLHAAQRTFVSMDRDQPWSQNSAGRRGRAGYKRAA